MNNLTKTLASIVVAAVFTSASPASAQYGTPAYNTTYYSDATHQTEVGYMRWSGCDYMDNPQYELEGSQSQYEWTYFIGYCKDGQMTLGPMPEQ